MFFPHTRVLSVKVCTLSKENIKKELSDRLFDGHGFSVFTPNTQMLLASKKERSLRTLLNSSSINIPDGIGIRIAARLKGNIRLAKTSGIDLAEELLPIAEALGIRVFFLGGKEGVAPLAKRNIQLMFPNLNVCGTHHGYFTPNEEKDVIAKILSSKAELLFVCMGFPRQEKWIIENLPSLPCVKVAMGLGGTLDVWAKKTRRAPKIVQNAGLEWLWRVILEPSRAKIFLDVPKFFFALAGERKKQIY